MKIVRYSILVPSVLCGWMAAQTPITVTVTDANGQSTSKTYITVVNPAPVAPLAITTTTLAPFTIGVPYTQSVFFSGGNSPDTCAATGLPVGISIVASATPGVCLISGTPTTVAVNPTPTPVPAPVATGYVALPLTSAPPMYPNVATGVFTDLSSIEPFFGTWEYNVPITNAPVHALSATIMAGLASSKPAIDQAWGINVVDSTVTPYSSLALTDVPDSLVTQVPVPGGGGWIEGGGIGVYPNNGGDAHRIIFDRATGFSYESFVTSGLYSANASQFWDTTSPLANRPYEFTSVSADGLPILPGILDYNEALVGIKHALRMTASGIDGHKFMEPASHSGTPASPGGPIMGSRLRLRASWQPLALVGTLSTVNQNIINALKTYGVWICDTGTTGYISSTNDPRWNGSDGQSTDILKIFGRNNTAGLSLADFDMVDTGESIETYYAESPKGQGPNIINFSGARDSTGANEIFTVSSTGAYYSYIDGYVPFRGNTVELPYQAGVTVTLTECNAFACSSAQTMMQ